MSSGLTLAQARALLPAAALPASVSATAAGSTLYINAATSWLMSHGKWRGTVAPAVFQVQDNEQVTLPRGMLAMLGASLQGTGDAWRCSWKVQITNLWYSWISGGPGIIVNPPYDTSGMVDQGSGFVIFRDLPSTGTIKVYATTTETSGSINIRGFSSGGKVYTGAGGSRIEGENVAMPTTTGSPTTTITTWDAGNSLYAVIKPSTNGVIQFYQVASDLTETLIGSYEPGETNPNYRRYYVPMRWKNNGQVVALCKRKQVDVVVDNDQIVPGNLQALEMALMAVNFRRKAEQDRADWYMARAIEELNSELGQFDAEQGYGAQQIDLLTGFGSSLNLV